MKVLRAVSALMIALGIAFIGIGMASAGDGGTQNKLDRAISGGGIVRLHIFDAVSYSMSVVASSPLFQRPHRT